MLTLKYKGIIMELLPIDPNSHGESWDFFIEMWQRLSWVNRIQLPNTARFS